MSSIKNRQRYSLVNKSHQYRFLAIMLGYNLIIVAFLVISLFLPDILQLQDESLSFDLRAAAADKILFLHARIWPTIIALICLIGLHSFRVFHRFVGPLYIITRAFGRVRDGELNFRVSLRKKDYLHGEKEAFNGMLDKLAEKMKASQNAGRGALESVGELEKSANGGTGWKDSDKKLLSSLRKHLDILTDSSQYFKLPDPEEEGGHSTADRTD